MRRAVAVAVLMALACTVGLALAQRRPMQHTYSQTKIRNHNANPIRYDTLAIGGSGTQLVLENLAYWGRDSVNALGLKVNFITKQGALPFLTFTDTLTANQWKHVVVRGPIAFPADSAFLMSAFTTGVAGTVVDSFRCVATFTPYPSR